MSALTRFLYPVPDRRRTAGSLLRWWEGRRLSYNLVVGAAGLATVALVDLSMYLPPAANPAHGSMLVPWQPIVAYGLMANLCYSFGWATEWLMARLWGDEVLPAGGVLFRQGVIFSVGLTLLPIIPAGLFWLSRIVGLFR